jgi:hypothetical protein
MVLWAYSQNATPVVVMLSCKLSWGICLVLILHCGIDNSTVAPCWLDRRNKSRGEREGGYAGDAFRSSRTFSMLPGFLDI